MKFIDPKIDILQHVPGLQHHSPRSLRALPSLLDEVRFDAGDVLVRQGATGRQAFIVIDGQAQVLVDGECVATVGPGSFVGEMAMLDYGRRTATVIADSPMRALVAGPRAFPSLMSHAGMARAVAVQLSQRLRQAERPESVRTDGHDLASAR
jgi:CRP-like cAMP-binding protein